MKRDTPKVGRAVRYRGIGIAAEKLEVTSQHLRLVLNGERQSPPLIKRVRKLFPSLLEG
jgi:hypothetical protein